MNKPDFTTMNRSQLWHYVVEHRDDHDAFHALMDLIATQPSVKVESMEHLARLIEERDRQKKQQYE